MKRKTRTLLVWLLIMTMVISNITPNAASAKEKGASEQKATTTISTEKNNLKASGTNSFGNLIAELLNDEIEASSDYLISDLEIDGKQAKVSYSVKEKCSLVVAIYDEQGVQMLGSGMKNISASKTEVTIDIDIADKPQYFLVKAFLLDSEKNTALGQVYTNDHYKKSFQEFLDKTVDDFDKDKVLNLDEDITTNFAVFNNETVHIEEGNDKNKMSSADLDKNVYVISNADDKLKGLQVGEIFYYTDDTYDIMVKIKNIQVQGDTVTITAENAALDEIFSYVKIEADTSEAEITMDNSDLGDEVTYLGSQEEEPDFANSTEANIFNPKKAINANKHYSEEWHIYELKPELKQSSGNVSAGIAGEIKVAVSYRGDIDVYLDHSRFEVDFTISPAFTLHLNVKGSVDVNVPLGKNVALNPIPGVFITFDPRFKASLSAEMSANIKGEFTLGMGYDSGQNQLVNKSKKPTVTADYDMNASVYIGFSLEPKAKIISDYLAAAWLKIDAGFRATISASGSTKVDTSEIHDCSDCFGGNIYFQGSLSAGADVNLLLKEFHPSKELWKPNIKIIDFYYSMTYNEGGMTTCPHIRYLTTVSIADVKGRAFSGIKAYFDGNQQAVTNKLGNAKVYLANGTHTVMVRNPNNSKETKTIEFEVEGKSDVVQLKVAWDRGNLVNIKVVDIYNNAAPDIEVYCSAYEDANVTDDKGETAFTAPNGSYNFYMKDAEGNHISKDVTLNDADTSLTLQTTWNCSHLVTLYIKDKSGNPVAKAKVTYGSNKVTADDNGKAEIWVANGTHIFYIKDAEETMVLSTMKKVTVEGADVTEDVILGDDIESAFDESKHGNVVDSGDCSYTSKDNVKWKLYNDGLLCIYGQGEMRSYSSTGWNMAPWKDYCNDISEIIVSNGIKNIGEYAFTNCSILASIILPEGIESIDYAAFSRCNSLKSIILPEGLERIEGYTFSGCSSLKSVILPEGLKSIGGVFYGCSSLESIILPEGLENIGFEAFRDCSSLESITLPEGLESIGSRAFRDCSSLESIILPEELENIGDGAFSGCSSLKSVILPKELKSLGSLSSADVYAGVYAGVFYGCSSLKSIILPEGLKNISSYAFYNCNSLKSIILPEGLESIENSAFEGCSSLKSIILPEGIESIGSGAFSHCSSLKSIILPDGIETIEAGTFYACHNLENIIFPKNLKNINSPSTSPNSAFGDGAFSDCRSLKSIILPEGLENIGDFAFDNCSSLKSISLPKGLKSIGRHAFSECSDLEGAMVLEKLESIGDYAFSECYNLESVTFSEALKNIGNYAFYHCINLEGVIFLEGLESMGDYAFYHCEGLEGVTFSETIKNIGDYAFSRCYNLESITSLEGVESLGNCVFYQCSSLKSIILPKGLESIEERAFSNCTSLESVVFPKGLKSIGKYAFYECNLKNVVLSEGLESIGYGAFADCTNLESITLPEGLKSMGGRTFYFCTSLKSIVLPKGLESIGEQEFYASMSLENVILPEGLESIGDHAFADCRSLKSISIPDSVTNIGYNVFWRCDELTIYAPSGSYAETYAKENKIPFVATNASTKALKQNPAKRSKTKKASVDNAKYEEKQDAVAGQDYILLVLKDANAENILSSDNLLYIDQAMADDSGVVSYHYLPRETTGNETNMILGPQQFDLSKLEEILMKCENGFYTKESQEDAREELTTGLRLVLKRTFAESQREIDILVTMLIGFLDEVEEEAASSPTPDTDGDTTASPDPVESTSPNPENSASPNPTSTPDNGGYPSVTPNPTTVPTASPGTSVTSEPTEAPTDESSVTPSAEPTAVPTIEPTEIPENTLEPSVTPSNIPVEEENDNVSSAEKWKKGTKVTDKKTKAVYKITGTGKSKTVEYVKSTKKNVANVTIPVKVKLGGKAYKVTSLGKNAFKNNRKLKTVKIGKNVKVINKNAFFGCKKLTSVKMGKNVTNIGANAFNKCTALTIITIPAKVKKIGAKAFYKCQKLQYILVKTNKLTLGNVGKNAFGGGHSSPRVKTDKKIWERYSNIFILRGISKKALFIIEPVKLVI